MCENEQFPLFIFPKDIQEMIKTCNEVSNFPVPYTAFTILAAVSTAIGTTCEIKVKNGYDQVPMLYIALIGQPGIKKSPVIKQFFSPIFEWEIKIRKEFNAALDNLKEGDSIPKCRHLILDDTTVEALEEALSDNPWGVCLWADELVNWLGIAGRYSKDITSNSIWAKIFNSMPIFMNRKNTRKKIEISRPFVTVIGGIQYNIFKKHFSGDLRDNGLLSRLIPVFDDGPDRMPYDSYENFPQEILDNWKTTLDYFLEFRRQADEMGNTQFLLSEDAANAYDSWSHELTDKVNDEEPVELREFFAKLKDYVFRFSLIIELIRRHYGNLPNGTTYISGDAMIYSGFLADYIFNNYKRVLSILRPDESTIPLTMREVYKDLPVVFQKKDVNTLAGKLGLSDSWADKFCSIMMKGRMIRQYHDRRGTYEKT